MPLLDLTEDEQAELVRVVRQAIEADRSFLAPRAKRLRIILSKLNPASRGRPANRALVIMKLWGGRRRR